MGDCALAHQHTANPNEDAHSGKKGTDVDAAVCISLQEASAALSFPAVLCLEAVGAVSHVLRGAAPPLPLWVSQMCFGDAHTHVHTGHGTNGEKALWGRAYVVLRERILTLSVGSADAGRADGSAFVADERRSVAPIVRREAWHRLAAAESSLVALHAYISDASAHASSSLRSGTRATAASPLKTARMFAFVWADCAASAAADVGQSLVAFPSPFSSLSLTFLSPPSPLSLSSPRSRKSDERAIGFPLAAVARLALLPSALVGLGAVMRPSLLLLLLLARHHHYNSFDSAKAVFSQLMGYTNGVGGRNSVVHAGPCGLESWDALATSAGGFDGANAESLRVTAEHAGFGLYCLAASAFFGGPLLDGLACLLLTAAGGRDGDGRIVGRWRWWRQWGAAFGGRVLRNLVGGIVSALLFAAAAVTVVSLVTAMAILEAS